MRQLQELLKLREDLKPSPHFSLDSPLGMDKIRHMGTAEKHYRGRPAGHLKRKVLGAS